MKKPIDLVSHVTDSELKSFLSKWAKDLRENIKDNSYSILLQNKEELFLEDEKVLIIIVQNINKLKKIVQTLHDHKETFIVSEEDNKKILIMIERITSNINILYNKYRDDLNHEDLKSLISELEKIKNFFSH